MSSPSNKPSPKPSGTDSVSKKQSFQEWAMAGGGVPLQYKGREHVWDRKVKQYAEGGEVGKGGAAFGVFPQMKPRRSKQDREAAKNVPVDLARGFVSGVLGAPGDIESLARLPYELITGKDSPTFLPTSEDIEKRLPFRSEAPVSRAASGAGQLAGGFYMGPGSPLRAVGALPGAIKHGAQEFAMASTKGIPKMFIGPKAKTWDQAKADAAARMEKQGVDPVEIWRQTGTFRGADGIPRQEISDANAVFRDPKQLKEFGLEKKAEAQALKERMATPVGQKDMFPKALTEAKKSTREKIVSLKDEADELMRDPDYRGQSAKFVLDHPELYKAYPELADINVTQGRRGAMGERASISGNKRGQQMDVTQEGLRNNPRSSVLHEMQHAVQTLEDMAPGGNPQMAYSDPRAFKILDELRQMASKPMSFEDYAQRYDHLSDPQKGYEDYVKSIPKIVKDMDRDLQSEAAMQYYKRLAGEAEARATQAREPMSSSQRAREFPYNSYDVPPEDLIVKDPKMAGGGAIKEALKKLLNPKAAGGEVRMDNGGAAFGQYTTGRKYQAAKKRAENADVNALPDPRTYAAISGLLGEAPDELGFSVLHPDYKGIQDVGEKGFIGGTLLGMAPAAAPMTKGLPIGASIKPTGGDPKKLLGKADAPPKGVEPIIVRTPEERAVMEKFGQKQEQEAVRLKKVEKAAKESAGKSPEESAKPIKSKGPRVKVEPDFYRKMAEEQGDEAVLKAARAGKHLKPTGKGYIGGPRTVTSPQGLGMMRRDIDTDFADSVEAVRLADPDRLGTWYDRAKQGIAESSEPYQLPRTLEQHGVYSAGVSPESELAFSLKHLNSRVAGDPQMAYRGAGMRNLDKAVAENRPANMGFKIGEYAEKNDPRVPNEGLFGVNDFRRAQGMGYTDPQGNPWKAGVSDTMHPFMDAETALQVDRANTAGTGGRTDWGGPHIQEVPWVYGKGQDLYSRGKQGRYGGDELEGMMQSLRDANNTARDYFYKHAASATHEQIPGAGVGHVRQALNMTPEEKLAYGREGRFDMPAPEMALNEYPQVGAGNRDAIYGALGYRQLPSRDASGLYINSLGEVEKNPMTIARPLMDFPTGGGGGKMATESRNVMNTAEQFRALMDAQEAGAYNLPNTMAGVKGKNAMVLDTRGQVADPLADPSAGVLPSAEQLGRITNALNEASGKAATEATKLRDKMPYGPPTKSVANKLVNLDDAAGGYGVTATNRGALIFPYNSQAGGGGLKEIMKMSGEALEGALPGARREKAIATTGYVPGVGKRTSEGPQLTAPYSGEATSDMLRAFSELPQNVAMNLGESESVRAAIRAKALRDSKLGSTRGDIQETRRFFSEADWPKAVEMIRRGMTPAAALAALGYSAGSMAGER